MQQLEADGAEQAAVELAGAADHQHQHHVGAAVEVEHVERGEAGGLREQRAGRAGHRRRDRVDRRPGARRRSGRSPRRAAGCRGSPAATSRTASGRCAARSAAPITSTTSE